MIKTGSFLTYCIFTYICSPNFKAPNNPSQTIFIENEITTSQAYIGQPFLLKTYVIHKANIKSMDLIETDFSHGASMEDIKLSLDKKKFSQCFENGFFKQLVFTKVVTPFRLGTFSIEGSLFRVEFQSSPGLYKSISPNKVFYTVLSNQREDPHFNQTIGNISIKTKISPPQKQIDLGQSIQIELKFTSLDGGVKLMKLPPLQQSKEYTINLIKSSHNYYFLHDNTLASCKRFTLLFTPNKPGTLLFPELKISSFLPQKKNYKNYKIDSFPIKVLNSTERIPPTKTEPQEMINHLKTTNAHYEEIFYSLFSPGIGKKILGPISLSLFFCSLFLYLLQIIRSIKVRNLFFSKPQLTHKENVMELVTSLEKQIHLFFQKNQQVEQQIEFFQKKTYPSLFSELQDILFVCQKLKYQKESFKISLEQTNALFQEANLIAKKIKLHCSL